MEDYVSAVEKGIFPVYRGHALTNDDLVRKDVIQKLRNYFEVDIKRLELEHDISFAQYFHDELSDLKVLDKDGIISFTDDAIRLSEFGRRFTNIACRVFDTYYSGKLLQQDLGHRTLDTHEKSV